MQLKKPNKKKHKNLLKMILTILYLDTKKINKMRNKKKMRKNQITFQIISKKDLMESMLSGDQDGIQMK